MASPTSKKLSGLFKAFKLSTAKTRETVQNNVNSEETAKQIRPIEYGSIGAERIRRAIEKAFSVLEDSEVHVTRISERISQLTHLAAGISRECVESYINSYFAFDLYKKTVLKRPIESQAVFKQFKQIASSIIFVTIRNFSIQKHLSITA